MDKVFCDECGLEIKEGDFFVCKNELYIGYFIDSITRKSYHIKCHEVRQKKLKEQSTWWNS